MKQKKVFGFLLSLLFVVGICNMPVKAAVTTQTDVDVIKAEERVSYLTQDKLSVINYEFTQKSQGKWISIQPMEEGTLFVGYNTKVYDVNKKEVQGIKDSEDSGLFIKNVKKTDVYYIKLDDAMKQSISIQAYIKKDNVQKLDFNILYTQTGQNKNIYQTFDVTKRGVQKIYLAPVAFNGEDVTFYVQKNENGTWKSISKTMTSKANDHVQKMFVLGLKQGQYRIVSKSSEKQIYQVDLMSMLAAGKYQTKKSKAQTIKLGKTNTNIYTASEKASRWYKVSRSATKKNHYVKLSVNNNSGNIKYTIYKKGRSKALKSYTLSGTNSKTYRLNSGKGTYYVKVSKSGSKMNGQYSIQYK